MKKQQMAGNLDAIRAKWKRNVVDSNDVPALLAYIDELERERDALKLATADMARHFAQFIQTT